MRNGIVKAAIVRAEVAADIEAGLDLTREKALEAGGLGAELIVFPDGRGSAPSRAPVGAAGRAIPCQLK